MREIKRKVERRLCLLNGPTRMGAPIKEKKAFFWNEIFPTMTEYEHSFFYFSIFLFSFII